MIAMAPRTEAAAGSAAAYGAPPVAHRLCGFSAEELLGRIVDMLDGQDEPDVSLWVAIESGRPAIAASVTNDLVATACAAARTRVEAVRALLLMQGRACSC